MATNTLNSGIQLILNQKDKLDLPENTNALKSGIQLILNQKDKLDLPENIFKEIVLLDNANPYHCAIGDMTIEEFPNNAGKTGFNNWGYLIVPPENSQINNYISLLGIDYDGILAICIINPTKFTVVETSGILTDFNYTEPE